MRPGVDRVFDEALSLPADARISLVEKLLMSLNLPIQAEIDHLWAEEAERRVAETDRGEVQLIPGEKVLDKIRQKHQAMPGAPIPLRRDLPGEGRRDQGCRRR